MTLLAWYSPTRFSLSVKNAQTRTHTHTQASVSKGREKIRQFRHVTGKRDFCPYTLFLQRRLSKHYNFDVRRRYDTQIEALVTDSGKCGHPIPATMIYTHPLC